jgi:hypothetical protein
MLGMKKLIVLLLSPALCLAEDWTLLNGKSYKDVKVTSQNAVTVEFMHSSGAARADFMEISEEARKKLGFDQAGYDAAKKAEKEAAAKNAAARRDMARAVAVSGLVLQVMEDGFLTAPSGQAHGIAYTAREIKGVPVQGTFWITGHPDLGKLVDRDRFVVTAVENGVHTYTTTTGANATVKSYRVVKAHKPEGVTGRIPNSPPFRR